MRAILLLLLASLQLFTSGAQDHDLSLSNAERKAMLEQHNKIRNDLRAKDILIMQWDFQLEELANIQVGFILQNECIAVGGGVDKATGQLVGMIAPPPPPEEGDPPPSPAVIIPKWFAEGKAAYDKGDLVQGAGYIQLAWAAANRVGCAKTQCKPLNETQTMEIWVCNYNQIGTLSDPAAKPFREGLPCTGCPKTHKTCSQNLCIPVEADLGDFGAQVFPEGDEGNSTSDDTVPNKGYVIGGECPDDQKHVYVQINSGHFSNSRVVNAVVVVEIATQIYYSSVLRVDYLVNNGVGEWINEFPHLFTCVDYDTSMSISVYDCLNNTECGGEWGVPETMDPLFFFSLTEWDNFEDQTQVSLKGANDPRYLKITFFYAKRGTTSTGVIIGAIVVILAILIIAAGIVYWWQKKQNLAYHRANSNGIDRV